MQKTTWMTALGLIGLAGGGYAAEPSQEPVSFARQVVPILTANCTGCHKPDKTKGDLDLTTYEKLMKGGKHGKTVVPGNPDESGLILTVSGEVPEMPEEGDPLKPEEIELLRRWVAQGAKDDTQEAEQGPIATPVYRLAPVVTSLAYSPDGAHLAVAGHHEVLLHKSDGSALVARLIGRAPRVESLAYSKDGSKLAVVGGAPGLFGHVQVWNTATNELYKQYKISQDSLYGVSFAPDGASLAFGGADKAVRRVEVETGNVVLDFRAHADWVFGTAFTLDGKQLVSAGRDMALKYINLENQQFIDDINNPKESVVCFSRHPKEEMVVYGGHLGGVYMYKISDNQQRTAGRNDTNLIRQFGKLSTPAYAVAFSGDGSRLAIGGHGEVRIHETAGGKLLHTLSNIAGPVYSLAWKPDGSQLAAAGHDGLVRIYDAESGRLVKEFVPVPLENVASR